MVGSASVFDGCDDSCGWIAAVVAALAYGSFGVPIKATVQVDVRSFIFVLLFLLDGTAADKGFIVVSIFRCVCLLSLLFRARSPAQSARRSFH